MGEIKEYVGTSQEYYLEISDINEEVLEDIAQVGTGSTIKVLSGEDELLKSYKVVIKGDVTGDGYINVEDVSALIEYVYNSEDSFMWNKWVKIAAKMTETEGEPRLFDIQRIINQCLWS